MSNENIHFKELFGYCCKMGLIPKEARRLLILDCDTPSGALVTVSAELKFTEETVIRGERAFDLVANTANALGKDQYPEIIQDIVKAKKDITRHIQSKGRYDDSETVFGVDVSCSRICEICAECAASVRDVVNKTVADGVWVMAIGTNIAFYPVEHAVRTAISPLMPFGIIPNLIINPSCVIDVQEACAQGRVYLEENSTANIPLAHNISLQLRQGDVNGDRASVVILATRGTTYAKLADSEYTQPVFAVMGEPITLVADSKPYKLSIPHSAFKNGASAGVFRFAVKLKNDVPTLEVCAENGTITNITLEKQIYAEE